MYPFTSEGIIIYHSRWVIMECPKDILDYYHYWIHRELGIKLHKPRFGSHISIIRGDEIVKNKIELPWKRFHEQTIEFSYSNEIETNGDYFWLPVNCLILSDLRKELGLNSEVPFGFHLTIGKR